VISELHGALHIYSESAGRKKGEGLFETVVLSEFEPKCVTSSSPPNVSQVEYKQDLISDQNEIDSG